MRVAFFFESLESENFLLAQCYFAVEVAEGDTAVGFTISR